ncbi:hypothetical protein EDE15_1559 [Edaphobacter aggregans]|uniref:Uncharacterized protein n=1 Tax=Edaphobacter aggregans TaxID=570835 RepID=A0A428MGU6_9BACT|nr:hypothetical protein [Edaphobacter aggregans]RSL16050.1 hypothetical protein EDE15_1559 [Edaphobacter aggregans]
MIPTHTSSHSPEHVMQESKRKPALSPAEILVFGTLIVYFTLTILHVLPV